MPENLAHALAYSKRGYVEAPAGCGKTHLIAEAVGQCTSRQLILTHTHAGVRAILDHMRRQGVPHNLYRVGTINGFALKYASSFPSFSKWRVLQPGVGDWHQLPAAAELVFSRTAVASVLKNSFGGLIIDEYQDCTTDQHNLLVKLSGILPCRVLGDPLQSVFGRVNKSRSMHWNSVKSEFEQLGELRTPHRWTGNMRLGEWLLHVRDQLISGSPVDLSAGPIYWSSDTSQQAQLGLCRSNIGDGQHTVVGLRDQRAQCHHLLRYLNNSYNSLEDVEAKQLMDWADRIHSASNSKRVEEVVAFSKAWLGRLPEWLERTAKAATSGRSVNRSKWSSERNLVFEGFSALLSNGSYRAIDLVLERLESLSTNPVHVSREMWRDMRRALSSAQPGTTESLSEAVWRIRDRSRRIGRIVPRRCLSTTLLVKGLQFDRALVLSAGDLKDAENLYVALTRGASSVAVLSDKAVISRPKPQFMLPVQ